MKENQFYYYNRKYKSKNEMFNSFVFRLKDSILYFFLNSKFLKSKLHTFDSFIEYKDKKEPKLYENLYIDTHINDNQAKNYKNLELPFISFFEVIEIDKFDNFRKKIISKFSSKHSSFGRKINFKDELIQKLSEIKINLDTSSFGKLISLNYKKLDSKKISLIDSVQLDYIKTNESFFIVHIRVTPSSKFVKLFTKIKTSPESSLSVRHYNSVKNILKYRVFDSHTTFIQSLTRKNIDNLISDLKHQVDSNIIKHLNGYFQSNNSKLKIPSIEHYTIKNFHEIKRNKNLFSFLNFSQIEQFSYTDGLLDVYIESEKSKIYIFKETGHGKKDKAPDSKDFTDYDRIESYYLINSLAFPCVFNSILNTEFSNLNTIKRKMYDFLENSNKWNVFKHLLIFYYNNKYISLKKQITKLNLISKRFKNEFNDGTIKFFLSHADLTTFKYFKYLQNENTDTTLLKHFTSKIKVRIEQLNQKKDDINDVFKNIEELNIYRTNYLLQIVSLFIAILAFIFAFDKVKDLFVIFK